MKSTTINFKTDMKKILQSLFGIALFTTLLVNCGGGGDPIIKEAKDGIQSQNYMAAIATLDSAIAQDPSNAIAHYYKGLAYAEMATNNSNVSARKDPYGKMRENLLTAQKLYAEQGIQSVESVEAELLIDRKWGLEHNAAVQYATGDSAAPQVANPLDVAVDHLENAIIINPDSLLSYDVLAEVHRLNNNIPKAVETMEMIVERKETPDAYDYDRLGGFYLLNEDYDNATRVLEEAAEMYPDSVSIYQKLADAYMNSGQSDESIRVLETLISNDPQNPQYHLVLGTQIYIIASDINEEIEPLYAQAYDLEKDIERLRGNDKAQAQQRLDELNKNISALEMRSSELTDQASEELTLVTELLPDDARAYNILGILNQNRASLLFEKRTNTVDNDKAAEIYEEAKSYLTEAMVSYEKAAEIEPDNTGYWESLFRVYTALGMNEKAEEAMKKAGM